MGKAKTQERLQGKELYVSSSLTLKQVSDIIKVNPTLVGKWAKEDEWELQRNARQATAEMIIANYYTMIANDQKKIMEEQRTPTPAEMDKLHKMADSIEKLKKKMNIGNYYNVLTEFAKYLMDIDNESAKQFAPIMLEFMKEKVKQLNDA